MARATDHLAESSLSDVTVQIGPGGGTQGMDPMHLPAAPDIPGMGHLSGDRR
jgi:hypothetical protein